MIFGWKFNAPDKYCAYLSQDQAIEGVWIGNACEAFGVKKGERVSALDFHCLQENKHAITGERLTRRQNKTRRGWEMLGGKLVETEVNARVKFWDFTSSMPKTFSVLWKVGECPEVMDWHLKASSKAFRIMEECTTHIDAKGGRKQRVRTGKFCAVRTTHVENRCSEPQIHDHWTIFNATPGEKGNYAIESSEWFDRCKLFTAIYRDSLAASALSAGHRLEIDEHGAPQLALITDCIKPFSQRSEDVEHLITAVEGVMGSTLDNQEKKRLVLVSRGLDLVEFRRIWAQERPGLALAYLGSKNDQNARARLLGAAEAIIWSCCDQTHQASIVNPIDPEQLARIKSLATPKPPLPPLAVTAEESIDWAIRHCFANYSIVKAHRLYAEAINYAMGSSLDLEKLKSVASAHPELIHRDGEITTKTHLRREEAVFKWVTQGVKKGARIVTITNSVENGSKSVVGLSEDQLKAINQLLSCTDQFTALIGKSGSGKTVSTNQLILANLKMANESGGYRVLALAPSTKSRDVIEHSDKMTLQGFLKRKAVQDSLRPMDLVVLDEAGFASMEQVHDLFKLAIAKQFRVCLVGDPRQNTSVEAGDAFRLLLDRTKIKREWLDKIIRQRPDALGGMYLKAAKAFSQNKSTEAFTILDKAGAIEVALGQDRIDRVADLIVSEMEAGRSVVAVNPSHRENDAVNEAVRKRLVLGEERLIQVHRSLGWTLAQRQQMGRLRPGLILEITVGRDKGKAWTVVKVEPDRATARCGTQTKVFTPASAENWQVCQQRTIPVAIGDWMVTHAAMKKTGNGEKFQVCGFTKDGNLETMAPNQTGQKRVIETKNLAYAYAGTSHRSQGDTADTVIFGMDRESINWVDLKLAYVAATRGRSQIKIFVESKADLLGIQNRSGDRKSASEMIKACISMIQRKPVRRETVSLKVAA